MNNKQDDNKIINENSKVEQLYQNLENNTKGPMTSDAGLKISNSQWSLKAGERGPTMFQDFHFYKKQSHFNRERIPERVVHARGYGAHGYFECTKSMKEFTKASFLQQPGTKVPVFTRFSTLQGGRGGGVDPDFHRRDLIEAIERKAYPEYEVGVQMIPEEDEFKYDFDVLDDTKFWPEEEFPIEIFGKMVLNRLTENEFAETEQAGFDPSNVVPGIDFSHDPVLQGRSFAYRDTQYHRLGTGNIEEIPINRPLVETNYNHRDSFSKYRIDADKIHYHGNTIADGNPSETPGQQGGFEHYPANAQGNVTRAIPSDSFKDHFSQARIFWNSLSAPEKSQVIESFNFHLGMVISQSVRQQNVDMFANVDKDMATQIAKCIGVNPPSGNHVDISKSSPALSMESTPRSAYTQKVGILLGSGFNEEELQSVLKVFDENGVFYDFVSDKLGPIMGTNGSQIQVNKLFATTHPALFDSLYVVGGTAEDQVKFNNIINEFVNMDYKYYKPIGVSANMDIEIQKPGNMAGVIFAKDSPNFANDFVNAIGQLRFWDRTEN